MLIDDKSIPTKFSIEFFNRDFQRSLSPHTYIIIYIRTDFFHRFGRTKENKLVYDLSTKLSNERFNKINVASA